MGRGWDARPPIPNSQRLVEAVEALGWDACLRSSLSGYSYSVMRTLASDCPCWPRRGMPALRSRRAAKWRE